MDKHTPGEWSVACDSYGKVQHSRKACVFTSLKGPGGDRLVNIAQRIENWQDAQLIAAAPELLAALEEAFALLEEHEPVWYQRRHFTHIRAAITKAKGE